MTTRCIVLAFFFFGNCGDRTGPPDPGYCDEPASAATIDGIYLLTDDGEVIEDGMMTPTIFGGQGTRMSIFRVGMDGTDVPPCAHVELSGTYLESADLVMTPREDGMWQSGPLSILAPLEAYSQTANAYGVEVRRDVRVDLGPGELLDVAASEAEVAPGAMVDVLVTVERETVSQPSVDVFARTGNLEPIAAQAEGSIDPGETTAVIQLRAPLEPGTYSLQVQLNGGRDTRWPGGTLTVVAPGG